MWLIVCFFFIFIINAANHIRFSEKIELFIAIEISQAQTTQMKAILNELDNGIMIAFKLPDHKFLSKYINKKIN